VGSGDRKQSPHLFLLIAVIFISSRDKSILGFMQTHIRMLQHDLRKSAALVAPVLWFRSSSYESIKPFHSVVLIVSFFPEVILVLTIAQYVHTKSP